MELTARSILKYKKLVKDPKFLGLRKILFLYRKNSYILSHPKSQNYRQNFIQIYIFISINSYSVNLIKLSRPCHAIKVEFHLNIREIPQRSPRISISLFQLTNANYAFCSVKLLKNLKINNILFKIIIRNAFPIHIDR